MRHMAVEFGLMDGWMRSMCLAELPRLPKLLSGGGLLSEYIIEDQLSRGVICVSLTVGCTHLYLTYTVLIGLTSACPHYKPRSSLSD